MNWMIDGAYGDYYRTAMGYRPLTPAVDEWAEERRIGRKPKALRRRIARKFRALAAAALGMTSGLLKNIRHLVDVVGTPGRAAAALPSRSAKEEQRRGDWLGNLDSNQD